MDFTIRELFGGAITTDIPEMFIDASRLRQVPDNQEVFLSPVDDVTFIIEILEKVKVDDLSKAAEFHFDSIANDNRAESQSIGKIIPPLTSSTREHPTPILLKGTQRIQKFNRLTMDDVLIYVAVFRLDTYNVDIVFSCNMPIRTGNPNTTITEDREVDHATEAFEHAVNSLKIVDYSLFVDSSED